MITTKPIASKMHLMICVSTLTLSACAGTPQPDRSPSWMKHHVVGTRIPRVTDPKGDASSADYVRTAEEARLEDLPGVHVKTCRSTVRC